MMTNLYLWILMRWTPWSVRGYWLIHRLLSPLRIARRRITQLLEVQPIVPISGESHSTYHYPATTESGCSDNAKRQASAASVSTARSFTSIPGRVGGGGAGTN